MKKLKNVIKWIISIFFILFGLVCISGSIVSGMLFFLGAILINPLFQDVFEKNGKKIKKRLYIPILAVLFLAGAMTSNVTPSAEEATNTVAENEESEKENEKNTATIIEDEKKEDDQTVEENNDSSFSMHFIDVDQGDSTLIECDGEYMLVDAGNVYKGTTVQLYLTKQGVKDLKYVVGTHPDADHIGGLDVIVTKYECEEILLSERASDTQAYTELINAINYKNYKAVYPSFGDVFSLGSSKVTVIGPCNDDGDDNNNSIVLRVDYGDTSFILSGDAEADEESEILAQNVDLRADVYHAGHHGSRTSTSDEWLKAISPEAVVISCGRDNSYGHPHAETLAALKNINASVYRTDEQGNIVVTSDGKKLTWSTDPSDSWAAGVEKEEEKDTAPNQQETKESIDSAQQKTQEENKEQDAVVEQETPEEFVPDNQTTYVINTNTKKFHYPYCSSASDIKAENRKEVTGTRDEVIGMGYVPCKRCNP